MINKYEFCERLGIDVEMLAYMHAKKITPEPIRLGHRDYRWREEDVQLFCDYLMARGECAERGIDPNSEAGPAPPIYSTAGDPRLDVRLIIANQRERARQAKSKTLAAGTKLIAPQPEVTLPEVNTADKVEG